MSRNASEELAEIKEARLTIAPTTQVGLVRLSAESGEGMRTAVCIFDD